MAKKEIEKYAEPFCKYLRDEYKPLLVSESETLKEMGITAFVIKSQNREITVIEKENPSWFLGDKKKCQCCGKKITGIFGLLCKDDIFFWLYTQRSGFCESCALKKVKRISFVNAKKNAILYENCRTFETAKGSRSYYENGDIIEDCGTNLLTDKMYRPSV